MNWQGTAVLVTGAGGFIGSHLAERLIGEGARVRAFVRYNSRSDAGLLRYVPPEAARAIEVVMGDLKDPESVRRAVAGNEVVFHLAALVGIPYSYHAPLDYVQTNVLGTAHLLAAARETRVRRVVQTSTSEVYGTAQYAPIDERHPLAGQSPYAASKIAADKLAEAYYRSFDLPVATIRPFNTFGPRQSARAVLPTIITQALAGERIRLGALHPTRDLTFVTDTVEAFLAVGAQEHALGEVFNVGTGREVSVQQLAQVVGQALGRTLRVEVEQARVRPVRSEVERLICNAGRARETLGWRPAVSLEDGVAATIEWIRAHLDLYPHEVYVQ